MNALALPAMQPSSSSRFMLSCCGGAVRCVSCGAVNDIRGHWLLLIARCAVPLITDLFLVSYIPLAICAATKKRSYIKFVLSKDAAAAVRPEYIAAARLLIFIAVRPEFAGSTPVHSSS